MPLQISERTEPLDTFNNFDDNHLQKKFFVRVQPNSRAAGFGLVSIQDTDEKNRNLKLAGEYCRKASKILAHVQIIKVELNFRDDCNKLDVILTGKILKVIHDIMFWGAEKETESLGIQISMRANVDIPAPLGPMGLPEVKLEIQGFKKINEGLYEKKDIEFPKESFKEFHAAYNNSFVSQNRGSAVLQMRMAIETVGYVALPPQWEPEIAIHPVCFKQVSLMKEGSFADFEIVASDGTAFPSYKLYLCAHSKVFERMLTADGNYQERSNNRLQIELENGVTPGNETVKAFVDYVHFEERKSFMKVEVALELFQLADKYEMEKLLTEIKDVIIGKGHSWFDVLTALKMFSFSVVYAGRFCTELKKKALHVVAMKNEKLIRECPVYNDIFLTAMSREMFAATLTGLRNYMK